MISEYIKDAWHDQIAVFIFDQAQKHLDKPSEKNNRKWCNICRLITTDLRIIFEKKH